MNTTLRSLKLPSPLNVLLRSLYYLGLSILSEAKAYTKVQKFLHYKYIYIHIIYLIVMTGLLVKYISFGFKYEENFSRLCDVIKTFTLTMAHLIIVLETIMTRDATEKFFRIYTKLHRQWSNDHQWKSEFKIYGKLIAILGCYIALVLLVDITYIFGVITKLEWLYFFVYFEFSVVICRFRTLQIVMYMELIRLELQQLNRELSQLAEASQSYRMSNVEDIICKDVTRCMKKYEDIFTMFESMKVSTSTSFLATFVQLYVKLLSDCYWLYWMIWKQLKQYGKQLLLRYKHPYY